MGASIRSESDHIPDIDFRDVEAHKFHLSWLDLDVNDRQHIWTHFKEDGHVMQKIEVLGVKRNAYYNNIRATLNKMAVEFHLYD